MNSYKTLAAAAHISGIPVRYAVSFGQAFHAGHYSTVKSFGDLVHREQIAGGYAFPDRFPWRDWDELFQQLVAEFPNAPRVDHDPVGRWNAEDKERQLKLHPIQQASDAYRGKRADVMIVDDVQPAVIPRRDYADKTPGRHRVVYVEDSGDEFAPLKWKVYDTKFNPAMRGINYRASFATPQEASRYVDTSTVGME